MTLFTRLFDRKIGETKNASILLAFVNESLIEVVVCPCQSNGALNWEVAVLKYKNGFDATCSVANVVIKLPKLQII